jgi:hypothetical protein
MFSKIKCFMKQTCRAIAKGFCNAGLCDSLSYNPFYMTYGIGMVRHYNNMHQSMKTIQRDNQ